MTTDFIFDFKSDLSEINIPSTLNNPFGTEVPEIARIASKEFQEFIREESPSWKYDFNKSKGKMFGVLVIQKADDSYAYLGAMSGNFAGDETCARFVPSIFDHSTDDYFMDKGMTELTHISEEIMRTNDPVVITDLTEKRKRHSHSLQQRLFESYRIWNIYGKEKNIIEIFQESAAGNPPSAAGECAAPKLLQYAFEHQLRPIALTEFWWGNASKNKEREHKAYYPACKNKCRPILEYMLDDNSLFKSVTKS